MSIEYYNKNADDFFNSTKDVDMSELYAEFTKHLKPGARILDAGCGSGRDTRAFIDMGYEVDAFDASQEMVERAKILTGIDVSCDTFEYIKFSRKYDGIWACASLLHVSRGQLPSVLNKLSKALSSGGVIYASFKYGDADRSVGGRSFTDMNESVIDELSESIGGISICHIWNTIDRRPERQEAWVNIIFKK
jgi:SAM-dependent methyltransferase